MRNVSTFKFLRFTTYYAMYADLIHKPEIFKLVSEHCLDLQVKTDVPSYDRLSISEYDVLRVD